MAIEEHFLRSRIVAKSQHPLPHSARDIAFNHEAFPGVTRLDGFLNTVAAVLYPQDKAAVANVAALPAAGNTLNDYRVVTDDGDGKAAGYRWYQHEGEVSASWHKVADYDWSADGILSQFRDKTLEHYVSKWGFDDLAASGTALAGALAGQHIYGGASAGTHLTLHANGGDGVGAQTGFIQFGDNVRPTASGVVGLGTSANAFASVYATTYLAGTLSLAAASLTDTSLLITMGTTALYSNAYLKAQTLTLAGGSITDTSGAITFGSSNLATTGTFSAGNATLNKVTAMGLASVFKTGTTIGNLTLGNGAISDSGGSISFGANNLSTSGSFSAGSTTFGSLAVGNTAFGSGTITTTAGDLALDSFTEKTYLNSDNTYFNALRGTSVYLGASTVLTDQSIVAGSALLLSATTISHTATALKPTADATTAMGDATHRYSTVYLSGGIHDGTNTVSASVLASFRNANVGVGTGYSLFWDGAKWVASLPDTEITHGSISGLTADDHTQYLLLAGRSGGQSVFGSTLSGENLLLSSTAHATKGAIIASSLLKPSADNIYDLGASGTTWKDVYTTGQHYGLRLANYTTAGRPAASAGNKGRLVWDTDLSAIYADVGGSWSKVGAEKVTYQDAVSWTGSVLTASYTVDGSNGAITGKVTDARLAVWSLKDNSNGYKQVLCDITATATVVTVTVGEYLPAGTYTLVGVG